MLTTTIGLQTDFQRALQDSARLWHGAFDRIDQQQAAIGHVEHALDLATEVGVARGIDDVDLHAFVEDGGVLGEDGDAALALEIVGIHDELAGGVWIAEDVRLFEQSVDQCRLAMVDVRDDRDIAQVGGKRIVAHAALFLYWTHFSSVVIGCVVLVLGWMRGGTQKERLARGQRRPAQPA